MRQFLDDEAGGDRRAVVVQHRCQPRRIHPALVDDQHAHLRIAVLFDHEHLVVLADEIGDLFVEGKSADAQRIEMQPLLLEGIERFLHRRAGRAVEDHAEPGLLQGRPCDRLRQHPLRSLELAQQPLHVIHVIRSGFAVLGVTVLGGAAGEKRAARRMGPRIGAICNAIAIGVEIAAELLS